MGDLHKHDRRWAREWGGAFIPPSKRDSSTNMLDHPLWYARKVYDNDLMVAVQKVWKNTGAAVPRDKMYILNLFRRNTPLESSFVILKFSDFRDLCIGTPAGEEVERESMTGSGLLGWSVAATELPRIEDNVQE